LTLLQGLIMQPVVGALSDKCTSRWGRRRPFLVAGSVIVIFNLATIGWTRDIMDVLVGHSDEAAVSNPIPASEYHDINNSICLCSINGQPLA
jgi:hypothetical protein